MKAYISVDMEGIVGVSSLKQVRQGNPEYQRARKWMTMEVKAVVEALLEQEAERIVVADSHGSMANILFEDLPEEIEYISGFPRPISMMNSIDKSFDFGIFVGYHPMKGVLEGFLAHTYSGATFQKIIVNGIEFSEFLLNASVAGHHNVPIILLTGDDKITEQAKKHVENIELVVTKRSLGRRATFSKHPLKIEKEIKEKIPVAIEKWKAGKIKPFKIDEPVNVEVELLDSTVGDAAGLLPMVERETGTRFKYTAKNILEAYKILEAVTLMSLGIRSL